MVYVGGAECIFIAKYAYNTISIKLILATEWLKIVNSQSGDRIYYPNKLYVWEIKQTIGCPLVHIWTLSFIYCEMYLVSTEYFMSHNNLETGQRTVETFMYNSSTHTNALCYRMQAVEVQCIQYLLQYPIVPLTPTVCLRGMQRVFQRTFLVVLWNLLAYKKHNRLTAVKLQ